MKRLLFATGLLLLLAACTQSPSFTQQDTDTQSGTRDAEQAEASVPYEIGLLDASYAANTAGTSHGDCALRDQDNAEEVSQRLRKAAEQGNACAQNELGNMYSSGEGVPEDYAQAMNWYLKAAEQGDVGAQHNLAGMYARGDGVPADYAQATNWYRKAAEQGDADEQMQLCMSYALGKGVPRDYVLAYAWCNLGVSRKNGKDMWAIETRNTISKILSATQLAEAQRLSRNWQKGQSIKREKR